MDFGPQQIGKWLVTVGVAVAVTGGLMLVLSKLGVFRLPGDLQFGGRNWRVYFPIVTCIVLSIILTLIVWIINYFRR
jgi:hypothetical protein